MRIRRLNAWDLSITEAVALQRRLSARIDCQTPLGEWELVAGSDVSSEWRANTFFAGVVLLRRSDWSVVERQEAMREATFPYHSGLLSFREAPALLDAFAKLHTRPDVVIIDGQGMAHPRRCGLASHVGLCLDLPTVGCAKTRLAGRYQEPAPEAGARSPLFLGDEVVGSVVRTRTAVKPLFISVGHAITLEDAVDVVLTCCPRYRQPEPIRQAHHYVNELRRAGRP